MPPGLDNSKWPLISEWTTVTRKKSKKFCSKGWGNKCSDMQCGVCLDEVNALFEESNNEILAVNEGEGPKGKVAPPGQKWQEVKITVDSGACDNVIPPNWLPGPIVPSEASQRGHRYTSASGHAIPNYGTQMFNGVTNEGIEFQMKFNVAGVKKPLGSVRRMAAAGSKLQFGPTEDYLTSPDGKKRINLIKEDGSYILKAWTLVPEEREIRVVDKSPGNSWEDFQRHV